jgi:hypothetical protein
MTITDADRRRTRIDAQVAYEEAVERLATLVHQVKTIGRRATKIGEVIHAIQMSPAEPQQSESALLMLAPGDFESLQFAPLRELANAIVAERREVTETGALARALGCNV